MTEEYDQLFKPHDLVRVRPSSRVGDSSHQHWGRAIYLGRRGDRAFIKPLGGHKKVEEVPFSDLKLWRKSGAVAQATRLVIRDLAANRYFVGKNKGWCENPNEASIYLTDIDARRALGKVQSKNKQHSGHLEIIPAPASAPDKVKDLVETIHLAEEKETMGIPVVEPDKQPIVESKPASIPFQGINDENRPYEPLKIEPSVIKQVDFLTVTAEIEQIQKRMKDDYQMMLEAKKSLQSSIARIRELNAIQAKLLESDDIFK